MPKVLLKITKGILCGKEFVCEERQHLMIGRESDCNIVLPEKTVSRYHCLLEIAAPYVSVRDLGSGNGTYLNRQRIGCRAKGLCAEEGRAERNVEFWMRSGDRLGIGPDCELSFSVLHSEDTTSDPIKNLERLLGETMKDRKLPQISGYRILEPLDRGGMGEVWRAEDKNGQMVALKLLPQNDADSDVYKRFLRETQLSLQATHPHVIRTFCCGRSDNVFYIAQELCEGGSVERRMKKSGGKLPTNTARHIILQVLDALDYLHHAAFEIVSDDGERVKVGAVVHRDLKTANILLQDHDALPIAKVADFGLAKAIEAAGLFVATGTGKTAGTPGFMPRQQILNYKSAQQEIDVWAAAAALYHMLTGESPKDLSGGDPWKLALIKSAIPIRDRNVDIAPALAKVIDEALIDDPTIRIKTAAELKQRIKESL